MAETKQKGKIRHVAVMSNDQNKLARFYTEVMGLEEVSRGGKPSWQHHLSHGWRHQSGHHRDPAWKRHKAGCQPHRLQGG